MYTCKILSYLLLIVILKANKVYLRFRYSKSSTDPWLIFTALQYIIFNALKCTCDKYFKIIIKKLITIFQTKCKSLIVAAKSEPNTVERQNPDIQNPERAKIWTATYSDFRKKFFNSRLFYKRFKQNGLG